jgi:hypothetical protein
MHPDDLLEQLKANANTRKQKNLDLIHAVCREQYERGSKDFSVATISRIAQERGGPATSTIHNKTGDDFKGLIKAWASHTGGLTRKVRKTTNNPVWDVLDRIPDPAVRSVMGAVLAENKKLRGEVNLLKQHSQIVIDYRDKSGDSSGATRTGEYLPADVGLTESEREALRHAISEKLLQDEGWKEDKHGRILTEKGSPIFKIGFATAIRKILGEPLTSDASRRIGVVKGQFDVPEDVG